MIKPFLGCLGALLLCGCGEFQQKAPWLNYHGNGTFHDAGYNTTAPRYTVDFGAVSLHRDAIYEYDLVGLPSDHYMVGFGNTPEAAFDPDVRVLLLNERSKVVVDEHARLSVWLTSHGPTRSLVYLQGEKVKHYDKHDDAFWEEHLGVKDDDGWGTMFEARSSARYRLRIEVVDAPVSSKEHIASLWVEGMSAGEGSRPWIDL
jgi:hypothetical protein